MYCAGIESVYQWEGKVWCMIFLLVKNYWY